MFYDEEEEEEEEPEIEPPRPAPRRSITFQDEVMAKNDKRRGRRGSAQSKSAQDWSKQMEGDSAFMIKKKLYFYE